MPTKPKRLCQRCRRPECECKPMQHSGGKTTDRGYGWDWQQLRKRFLASNPLCADCEAEGRAVAATEVHHRVKIKHDDTKRLDPSNLMGLCGPHHDARTARGE